MLVLDNPQPDLFDGWIPPELLALSEELAFADRALSDPRILEPFLKKTQSKGRPGVPVATYLRMMHLKERYQISYEVLVKEVSDSYKWRRFCHIPLTGKVPEHTTLIKLTGRYGEQVVKNVHDTVVRRAVEAKVIRGRKMRLDTTVTESNIHHPTDTGLLADGVRVVARTVKKIKEVVRLKVRFRDRMRSVKRRLIVLVKFLKGKSDKVKQGLRKTKEQILSIAQTVWAQALNVLQELQSGESEPKEGASRLRLLALPLELKHWLELMKRVLEQTRTVLDGNVHIPNRLISLFDPGARPIQKGKLFPRTEFGRKVLIQEAEKGLVTDYQIHHEGCPPDQPMLEPALDKHKELFGHDPTELAGDRGFHAAGQDERLHERGIKHVSIPVKGNKDGRRQRTEKSAWFRRLQGWRAGGEGKISLLKRKYGARRTKVRGNTPTEIALGWGIIAHNLVLLSRLGPAG
jgi:IS5 family transposase